MLWFLFGVVVIAGAMVLGAKYHVLINAKMSKFFGEGDSLPPDFQLWLSSHKGEYDTIGKAMGAWADARFGDKYNKMLR